MVPGVNNMTIFYLISNDNLAGFIITLAAQSIIISLSGIAVIKLLRKKSAPVRSLACTGVIAVLGLVLIVSAGFRIFGVSWPGTALKSVDLRNSVISKRSEKSLDTPISKNSPAIDPAVFSGSRDDNYGIKRVFV